jgi:hypothetical protein
LNLDPVLTQLGALLTALGISGTVGAAAAYGLFKWLGASWLNNKFSRDLEGFKADKNKELAKLTSSYQRETEHLRAEVSRLLDRATKFHAREYDVLPKAWSLLNEAYGTISQIVSVLQESPDLEKMDTPQLQDFVERSDLSSWQKEELLVSTNRNGYYSKIRTWSQINDAKRAIVEYNNYIILNDVFIEDDMAKKLSTIAKDLHMTLILRRQIEHSYGAIDNWEKAHEKLTSTALIMSEVKALIRNKMFDTKLPDFT